MKIPHHLTALTLFCAAFSGSALAANSFFAPGDLILYFQQEGGANTIYVNLGNAATEFRGTASGPGAPNKINFININTELTSAFGAGWASDTTIYAGLAAVWGTSSLSATLQDGDPQRTLYVSDPRNGVGTVGQANSTGYTIASGSTGMSNGASAITSMNSVFENEYDSQTAISPTAESRIDDQNPFLAAGIQGVAFNLFGGGVQQVGTAGSFGSFGAAGEVEFALDLYRILARDNVSGQVSGPQYQGTYEGTVTLNASGSVSFISQGSTPASAYTTWANTFSVQLPNAADREEDKDPDFDGINNLMEFVLNGNPAVSGQAILPTLNASGTNFVFNFTRRADSAGEASQVFEYSTNLVDWTTKTPISIPEAPGIVGAVTVGASTGTPPNEVQAVTISIPKGSDTKLFGRLKVQK